MKKNGECIYGCDYAGWDKQPWGYYTRKSEHIYMVVFNYPFSKFLTVKTPKDVQIIKATMLNGKEVNVIETARNQYNVEAPAQMPDGPFVIKLQVKEATTTADKYQDALT